MLYSCGKDHEGDEDWWNNNGGGSGTGSSYISAPSTIYATANGSSVTISWSAVSGASYYSVYRSSSAYGEYSFLCNSYSNTATDYNPLQGTNYYKVKASNYSNESGFSSYASVSISESDDKEDDNNNNGNNNGNENTQQKPSAPTGVRVSNEGSVVYPNVVIRWNTVSNATKYHVYKSTSSSGYGYSEIGVTTSNVYSDPNPPTNGAYAYYKVTAANSAGESAYSDYVEYTSQDNSTALAPEISDVSASGSASSITVSWTDSKGNNVGTAKSYEVYKRNPNTGSMDLLTTTTSRSYTDRNPHPGYNRYGVIAVNDAGKSAIHTCASNEISLSKPSSFSATKSGSYVNFTWSKVSGETGYQIFSSTSANGSYYIQEEISGGETTSKSIYYPANSGTVYFKIQAYWQTTYGGSPIYSGLTSYKSVSF